MAQIDLGSIKFNWKGSYSGATAYVVDDVVESSGSSYICILATTGNAPPNATYWEQMSSAGTNGTDGTDLTTTLTTQGDIVYRDGSGLQRLAAGTSGQALITGGTGANPSWGTVSAGKVLQVVQGTMSSAISTTAGSWVDTGLTVNITPSATSSKVLVFVNHPFARKQGDTSLFLRIRRDSTTIADIGPNYDTSDSQQITDTITGMFLDTPNTTSQITYKTEWNATNANMYADSGSSVIICMEIGA